MKSWEISPRTPHLNFDWDENYNKSVECPSCGIRFDIADQHYWERKSKGEGVGPRTKVFCTNKCRQKAYRQRKRKKKAEAGSTT